MRYGIFSDIHSNLEALEAVLEALSAERTQRYLCVGDIVGYGADPHRCIRLTRDLKPVLVAGNHDWASVGLLSTQYFNAYAKAAVEWTERRLRPEEAEFLKTLPLKFEDDSITVVHGTLQEPEQFHYIFDSRNARLTMELMQNNICFVGHSHAPVTFWIKDDEVKYTQAVKVKLEQKTKYIVNVGSVGQPRDGDPRAAYCVYDDERGSLEIKRVEYNIKRCQEKMLEGGLPPMLAARLEEGR